MINVLRKNPNMFEWVRRILNWFKGLKNDSVVYEELPNVVGVKRSRSNDFDIIDVAKKPRRWKSYDDV